MMAELVAGPEDGRRMQVSGNMRRIVVPLPVVYPSAFDIAEAEKPIAVDAPATSYSFVRERDGILFFLWDGVKR